MAYKRGFTTAAFETEAQHQQLGVVTKALPYFGAALPVEVEDKSPSPALWESTAHVGMKTGYTKDLNESHLPKMNVQYEDLEKYRKAWTTDCPASRDMRFQTENKRSTKAAPRQFQMPTVRLLPGTPRPLETFRERLLERHGILGLSCVRSVVAEKAGGAPQMSCADLQAAVVQTQVEMNRFELNQILGYFTKGDKLSADQVRVFVCVPRPVPSDTAHRVTTNLRLSSLLPIHQFVRTVVARTDGFFDVSPSPKEIFATFGGDAVAASALLERMQINSEQFPEVVDGVSLYLPMYLAGGPEGDSLLTLEALSLLLSDLYASRPQDYEAVAKSLFQ